jgi:hypothetical protein
MIFSISYRLVHCLLGCLMVLAGSVALRSKALFVSKRSSPGRCQAKARGQ